MMKNLQITKTILLTALVFSAAANLYASALTVYANALGTTDKGDVKINMMLCKNKDKVGGMFRFEPIAIDMTAYDPEWRILTLNNPKQIEANDESIEVSGSGHFGKQPATYTINISKSKASSAAFNNIAIEVKTSDSKARNYKADLPDDAIIVTKNITLMSTTSGNAWFLLNKSFSRHLNFNAVSGKVLGKVVYIGTITLWDEHFLGSVSNYIFESTEIKGIKIEKDKITLNGSGLHKGTKCSYTLTVTKLKQKDPKAEPTYHYVLKTSDGIKYTNGPEEAYGSMNNSKY